jgi:hypothetical protein
VDSLRAELDEMSARVERMEVENRACQKALESLRKFVMEDADRPAIKIEELEVKEMEKSEDDAVIPPEMPGAKLDRGNQVNPEEEQVNVPEMETVLDPADRPMFAYMIASAVAAATIDREASGGDLGTLPVSIKIDMEAPVPGPANVARPDPPTAMTPARQSPSPIPIPPPEPSTPPPALPAASRQDRFPLDDCLDYGTPTPPPEL